MAAVVVLAMLLVMLAASLAYVGDQPTPYGEIGTPETATAAPVPIP